MLSYEILMGASPAGLRSRAQEIMDDGWALGAYPTISLNEEVPWQLKDQSQRSWNFHIHSWDMLDPLLAAYSEFKQLEWLKICLRIALDWSTRYVEGGEDSTDTPFAWYDMAVGLRAYRLGYLLDAAREAAILSEAEDALLWKGLLAHLHYLDEDKNIAFHNNHGYYQVAGQIAMGRRFGGYSQAMADAHVKGMQRLYVMLDHQFAEDGVHREHSPDYHRMVYETLRGLISSGLVDDPQLIAMSERVERALAWFVMPNQRLVNFGDSDYRSVSRKPKQAEQKWRTAEMLWQSTGGLLGTGPGGGLKRFERGGYYIYRDPSAQFSTQRTFLAQTAAFHSRTHKHADDLSFIWYDRGSEILIDAGRYGYLGKTEQNSELWLDGHWYSDPKRVYCESTRAHNCLEFDRRNYPRRGVKPYGVALGRSLELPNGPVLMESECRHFKGNRHARLLILLPGEWLIVFDWFHDNLKQSREARQWFHFGEDWTLTRGENRYEATTEAGDKINVVPLLEGSIASRLYFGETDPELQGWWSPSERQLRKNYALCFEQSGITGSFATLFSFSDVVSPNFQSSRVNTSGRNLRLCWDDHRGSHRLEVARPAEGTLIASYLKG